MHCTSAYGGDKPSQNLYTSKSGQAVEAYILFSAEGNILFSAEGYILFSAEAYILFSVDLLIQ